MLSYTPDYTDASAPQMLMGGTFNEPVPVEPVEANGMLVSVYGGWRADTEPVFSGQAGALPVFANATMGDATPSGLYYSHDYVDGDQTQSHLVRRPSPELAEAYVSRPLQPDADGSLLTSARENSLLAAFWESYLPNSSIFPPHVVGYASGGWTNVVQDLYRKDPVLHYSLMANCFSAAGRLGNSRAMAEQSLRAHGRALHELRLALDHPHKARSDSVFSALRLMIVFSMFFSDRYEEDRKARARGWKEHNAGVLALLRARGPEAHMTGHGHQMFVDCRLALIITSIRLRQASPLSSHPWMTVPWTHKAKTPKDTLIDIMAGLPTVLEQVRLYEEMPAGDKHREARSKQRAKVVAQCWDFDRQFCTWFDTNIPKERLEHVESTIIYNPKFGDRDRLTTEDLAIVYIMSVYLSGCVLLYSTMHTLHVPDLPERAGLSRCMNRIISYLKVGFHPSTGQYGLEMTSFPIGLCLQILGSNLPNAGNMDNEQAMFMQLLETTRGREIRDFLQSMLNTNVTTQP